MSKGKVIHGFQERRQLENELQALSRMQDDVARMQRAQELARHGDALIPLILRHLDTDDPLLRGALGLLVSYLPPERISSSLRSVVANPQRSDQERMTALMFLERFLDEPVEESLYAQLRDPQAVIEQSLREVTGHQESLPDIIVDYVVQLQEEPVDVALMVLQAMSKMDEERTFPLLALLAQDIRPEVALAAIKYLEMAARPQHPYYQAVLAFLADMATDDIRKIARRSLRKLHMRGLQADMRQEATWRALITAPDMHGSQALWMIRQNAEERRLIGLLVNADVGVQFAFVLDDVPSDLIPSMEIGRTLPIVMGNDPNDPDSLAWFLEVPIGRVRRWMQALVQRNYIGAYQMPAIFRQYGYLFWTETQAGGEAAERSLPKPDMQRLPEAIRLFEHPALARWYVEPPHDAFAERRWLQEGLDEVAFQRAFQAIDGSTFPDSLWVALADHLRRLAEWFLLADEEALACHAVTGAYALEHVPYEHNPFAQTLVAKGLAQMFLRLRQERDRWEE